MHYCVIVLALVLGRGALADETLRDFSVKKLPARERTYAQKLMDLSVKTAFGKAKTTALDHWIEARELIRSWMRVAPNEADYQAHIVEAALGLTAGIDEEHAHVERLAMFYELRQRLGEFVAKGKDTAELYRVMAELTQRAGGEPAEVLTAYRDCLRLRVGHEACRAGYDSTVQEYEQSFCGRADIRRSLRFVLASSDPSPDYPRKVKFENRTLYAKKDPSIDYSSVESIRLSRKSNPPSLVLAFSEAGRSLFASVTGQNLGKTLVLESDGKVLVAPVIAQEIVSPSLHLTPAVANDATGERMLNLVCSKTERRQIPEFLKLGKR